MIPRAYEVPGVEYYCGDCGHGFGMHDGYQCHNWVSSAGDVVDCRCPGFVSVADAMAVEREGLVAA